MKLAIQSWLLASLLCVVPVATALDLGARSNDATGRDADWKVTTEMINTSIEAMNTAWYNQTDGRWNSTIAWWLTGNTLQAICDYTVATKDKTYLAIAENTVQKQSGPLNWWPEGGGYFRADSTDDTGWWGLAMIRLYDATNNSTYLDWAQLDADYMSSYWNASTCAGGIIWDIPSKTYKNAISNELLIKLAASLHNRLGAADTKYKQLALDAWAWFNASGMINAAHLINDGLADDCTNNARTVWTYNVGVVLGALAELHLFDDGGEGYLDTARGIADAAIASGGDGLTTADRILKESCESVDVGCDSNQEAFKGVFARNLAELNVVLDDAPYTAWLRENARSVWDADRQDGLFGVSWDGPVADVSIGTQASAVSLLVANIWKKEDQVPGL